MSGKRIAFDPKTGESFQINDSAYFILTLAREGRSSEEIATELSNHFNISYERALTDTMEFLVQLDGIDSAA